MRQGHCWQRQWLWVPDGHSWGAALYTVTSRQRENQKNNNDYRRRKEMRPHGGALATVLGVQNTMLSHQETG